MADPTAPAACLDACVALLHRCTFAPAGTEVTCAVSGGADSTALLALAGVVADALAGSGSTAPSSAGLAGLPALSGESGLIARRRNTTVVSPAS